MRQPGWALATGQTVGYPMHCERWAAMHAAPRCGARTRPGAPCRAPAMPNGRCRMHGGVSRSGTAHGRYRHGQATREARETRHRVASLVRGARHLLHEIG